MQYHFFIFNRLPLSEFYGADHVYLTLPVGFSMRFSHLPGSSFLLKILVGGRGTCNRARHRSLISLLLHSCPTAALDWVDESQFPFFACKISRQVCTGLFKMQSEVVL